MKPQYNGQVIANCPDCNGAVTTFERARDATGREHGTIIVDKSHNYEGKSHRRALYIMLRCAGCSRAGLEKVHDNGQVADGALEWFFPNSIERAKLPAGVPNGIVEELREAELCASNGAWRGASGLLRSTLEKLLRANGYANGSLAARIDQAAADHAITEARRKKAHDDVRVLGNDVLHDEWRPVAPDEVEAARHYVQRIAEDLYDDRPTVEALLKAAGRP